MSDKAEDKKLSAPKSEYIVHVGDNVVPVLASNLAEALKLTDKQGDK